MGGSVYAEDGGGVLSDPTRTTARNIENKKYRMPKLLGFKAKIK